jgi:hypothetical protein
MHQNPDVSNMIVLRQILNFIPRSFLNQTARKTGIDSNALAFSVLSRLTDLMLSLPLRTLELQAAWQPHASPRETHLP